MQGNNALFYLLDVRSTWYTMCGLPTDHRYLSQAGMRRFGVQSARAQRQWAILIFAALHASTCEQDTTRQRAKASRPHTSVHAGLAAESNNDTSNGKYKGRGAKLQGAKGRGAKGRGAKGNAPRSGSVQSSGGKGKGKGKGKGRGAVSPIVRCQRAVDWAMKHGIEDHPER